MYFKDRFQTFDEKLVKAMVQHDVSLITPAEYVKRLKECMPIFTKTLMEQDKLNRV